MISVALCTYNGARFLREQLHSIANQTLLPSEIVVSDDNSTDETIRILDGFQSYLLEHQVPVVLRRLSNPVPLGVVKNFEQAIRECRGDIVALCDQDDIWMATKLQRLTSVLASHPDVDLVFSNADLIGPKGKPTGKTLFGSLRISMNHLDEDSQDWLPTLMKRNVVTGATVVFRAELARRAMPFPAEWLHDEWLAIWACMTGSIHCVDEKLIGYRQHENNQVGVAQLTAGAAFQKVAGPRRRRNAALKARASALMSRVTSDELFPKEIRASVEEKFHHEAVRSNLPASRMRRAWPILREYSSGRYGDFGLGTLDAIRDLVQTDA